MNHYGAQMMRHWQAERCPEYRELEEPERFFTQLGEEIAERVEKRARSLGRVEELEEGEGYLVRLQRLNTARLQAEGEVVREYLLQEPEPSS
jgi:hypothetical protein